MLENELKWEKEYIDIAVKELLKESNTNFDSLIKNIENDIKLYDFIKKLVLEDSEITYVKTDEIIDKGSIYGILKEQDGICKINNKI